jgi:putative DNA primase/helicase
LPALEQAIIQTPESRLVVIDPITAYLGKTDANKNAEVRGALAPLAALAGKYKVAVLGVSHLTKNQTLKAIYRTMGSLAFTAAARAVWVVSKDKDNGERRLFTPCKCNLSVEPTSLAFKIIDGMVCFEPEQLNISTDEALSTEPSEDKGALKEAEDFLREVLKEGPMLSRDVWKEAGDNKISERTLKRAKANLCVISKKSPSGWTMELPDALPF